MNRYMIMLTMAALAASCAGTPGSPEAGEEADTAVAVERSRWVVYDPPPQPTEPQWCPPTEPDSCVEGYTCLPESLSDGECRACGPNSLPALATCSSSAECACGTMCLQAWDGRDRCLYLCDKADGSPGCEAGWRCEAGFWGIDLGACVP